MTNEDIIAAQLEFFAKNQTGCAFAAMAARDAPRYEWQHLLVSQDDLPHIDSILESTIAEPLISTLSLLFPQVVTDADLDRLIPALNGNLIYLHETLDTESNRCYRFRARVGQASSFISGFGPFEYMPKTRRAPHTSIVMRIKPRPDYDWDLKEPDKESEEGILHVADMDMKGVPDRNLMRMWRNTFLTTAGILGKKPDQESAAKTTFVIPLSRVQNIAV